MFDVSKSSEVEKSRSRKEWGVERRCLGEGPGDFKIVHSGAFSYTISKVLFVIKCRERYMYVIMVFLTVIQ